jgi:hypothetical protein
VHRQPTANGYQSIEQFGCESSVIPLAFPHVALRLKTVLD